MIPAYLPALLLSVGCLTAAATANAALPGTLARRWHLGAVATLLGLAFAAFIASGVPLEAVGLAAFDDATMPLAANGRLLGGAALLLATASIALAALTAAPASRAERWAHAAASLAVVAIVPATFATSLRTVYVLATVGIALTWISAVLDRGVGPGGFRAANRYCLQTLIGDLAILAAALLDDAGAVELAGDALLIAGAIRLVVFPLHGIVPGLVRLPGRLMIATTVSGLLLGATLLVQAFVVAGRDVPTVDGPLPHTGWLVPVGTLTAAAGVLLVRRGRGFRAATDLSLLVDVGHIAVAFGVGTPLALAAGLLETVVSALGRGALLVLADALSPGRQQRLRPPPGSAFATFAVGFGTISGLPPLGGFVARWILYAVLIRAGLWPIAAILVVVGAADLAGLLQRAAGLGRPSRDERPSRAFAFALAPLWLPLVPIVPFAAALIWLVEPIVGGVRPGVSWSLGAETLLDFAGVAALLMALIGTAIAIAGYVREEPATVRMLLIAWREGSLRPVRGALQAVAELGVPMRLVAQVFEIVGQGANGLLGPGETHFVAAFAGGFSLLLLLVALG